MSKTYDTYIGYHINYIDTIGHDTPHVYQYLYNLITPYHTIQFKSKVTYSYDMSRKQNSIDEVCTMNPLNAIEKEYINSYQTQDKETVNTDIQLSPSVIFHTGFKQWLFF